VSTDLNLELFWQIRSISKDLSGQPLSKEIQFGKNTGITPNFHVFDFLGKNSVGPSKKKGFLDYF